MARQVVASDYEEMERQRDDLRAALLSLVNTYFATDTLGTLRLVVAPPDTFWSALAVLSATDPDFVGRAAVAAGGALEADGFVTIHPPVDGGA